MYYMAKLTFKISWTPFNMQNRRRMDVRCVPPLHSMKESQLKKIKIYYGEFPKWTYQAAGIRTP